MRHDSFDNKCTDMIVGKVKGEKRGERKEKGKIRN
jgi:hypothetical protein